MHDTLLKLTLLFGVVPCETYQLKKTEMFITSLLLEVYGARQRSLKCMGMPPYKHALCVGKSMMIRHISFVNAQLSNIFAKPVITFSMALTYLT